MADRRGGLEAGSHLDDRELGLLRRPLARTCLAMPLFGVGSAYSRAELDSSAVGTLAGFLVSDAASLVAPGWQSPSERMA